ncbi:ubiquitin carboxyl-terminal hydrolase 40 [Trichonephila inaurata madagascariensis]|uniref:Ubiquitin carboxyl-terminal hydrolase 40 n=1 Tax=Trichonephila inaurata madagascariensis TaxID=2747483 RepID=A0A8X6K3G4_9ARAC|nr:ubiquitin carboxyl-terminal hydrolase 40 [Trichonephila inaurata madagascariensis]
MFGSLFDDERTAGVMTSVHTLPIPMPPNRRLPCGLSGIENQGATCYLNSLLQTLLYTPEFREGLFLLSDAELGSLENREKGKIRIIPLQLQRLFARLLLVDQQAASTTELTDSFGWSNNEELQQHDVQELNRILFSAIDSSLVGTSGKDLISQLYHGSTITEIVCQICGKISEREEDFLDLNVIVAGYNNLQDSLNATFLQTEIMKGKNQYRCSTCCNLVDAKKGLKIQCLPPILTLSLLRFSYDIAKGERFKETGKFIFPFEIDMAPYCNKEKTPDDTTYELFSVLIHSGCSSGGHYHAFIRDVDCLGKWLTSDEETCGNAVNKDNCEFIQDPVSLIKSILAEAEDHSLPVEFLSGEIFKWSGLNWNKNFKSIHGTIGKFLQKHSDVFYFNASSNIVYLNADAMNIELAPDCSTPSTSSMDCTPNSPKETKKSAVMNSLKLNIFDKKRPQNNLGSVSQNWFDFNDSRVSPIVVKDIEKQFSGKESAYMLFYRRKSFVRPVEAKGNPKYMMPERLLKLVEEENAELERQRDEYETALNTINLQVHLGNSYKCTNGVLEPKINEIHFVDLAIDKRKLLLDLRDCIFKLCSEIYPSQDFVLHTAREVPAGLHLYEELSESQNLESLKDLGILEGTKIFVWDGKQLGGEHFAIGVAHEPVLLNISVTLQNGETIEMSRGFPKTTTISELKVLISNLVPLPLEDIRFSRLDLQGEETRLSPLNENHELCTLSELSFIDGDNIVAESIKCDDIFRKEISNKITIVVQNCCQNFTSESNSSPQLVELTVELDNSVEQLRNLIVSKFNLDNNRSFILRKYIKSQSKRPPLHEHYTIREVGLVEASCLTIEEGEPPAPDQITIMFTVGIGLGDTVDFEVTVNKNMNIQECLRRMLSVAGLNGDAWHLRKTNWCGEPMEQLSFDGMTLEDESIQHGENLLIMEGRLPAKGFLTFAIWLFPTLENIKNTQKGNMNGLHSGIENLIQRFGDTLRDDMNRSIKLGEVELSSESTVADLKDYILTLPSLMALSLPNNRHLRLQLLDNGRPSRVIRGLSNTLRKLKIQSQSLAARILFSEEDLMHSEILLNICQRLPETKQYTPPLEMIWETSKSAGPKALKQAIADCIGCPVQRIVTAKHFPEKCQWMIIDDGTSSKKNARKKRWGTGKSNLRNSPYFIKDGDTIGVKDRLSDLDDKDDFLTHQDIEGQEILRIAAENKRIKRQEDKSPSRCSEWMLGGSDRELPRHAKKCEVGITIHVDDFT